MSITINFAEKYKDLICEDIPKIQCESYPHQNPIPEKYRKKFVHPENGFVKLFCEDYDGHLYDGHFTPEEQMTYRKMLKENSEDTGINVFDLFKE